MPHVLEKVGARGEHRRQADERVEGGDGLRERGRIDALGDRVPCGAASAERCGELHVVGHRPLERADRGGDAKGDAAHAAHGAKTRRLLRGEPGDAADAAERRGGARDAARLREAEQRGRGVAADERGDGDAVEFVELGRVGRTLEEVEHLLGDDEAARDVDGRDGRRSQAEHLGGGRWEDAAAHGVHTANRGHTRDGVGHRHQRRVQRRHHAPHNLVADDSGEREG
mmetsp:Transcript_32365/g.70946  ORF Transcript_32365/g.70946 Transcript_32365/m.70946 type:complete len:227 (+) Transcript_32365:1445-2125(+)